MKRRGFILNLGVFLTSLAVYPAELVKSISDNFKYIYTNPKLKNEFYKFLKNVFNLYPEDDFHKMINDVTQKKSNDKDIYEEVQSKIGTITPFFSIFSYQLPALFKQKDEMAKQTLQLLGKSTTYDGYLEVGSSGRYLDYLEVKVNINGKRYYADVKKPGYSITEMVDRGQIFVGADYIPMSDYKTIYSKYIKPNSLDLVTVYIGFHHCPLDLRTQYISSVRDVLRKGGKLVLRDHDCDTEDQKRMVALAHDVFNMGTDASWEYNQNEIRNFYSLDFIQDFIENLGFRFEKKTLFQDGDPTKNALMLFTKI